MQARFVLGTHHLSELELDREFTLIDGKGRQSNADKYEAENYDAGEFCACHCLTLLPLGSGASTLTSGCGRDGVGESADRVESVIGLFELPC